MNTALTENEYDQALELKRDLHMHPELSNMEYRTTERLKELHRPMYHADDRALRHGAELFAAAALYENDRSAHP